MPVSGPGSTEFLAEDRLRPVGVVGIYIDHCHPVVSRGAERLGGDGGLVQVAGVAERVACGRFSR